MATAKEKLTALADEVREISGSEGLLSLDAMAAHLTDANSEVSSQKALIQSIKAALDGKALEGGGTGEISLQAKTVTPSKSVQEVGPDTGYDGLSKVTVNAIPSEYIVPSGELEITENGTFDVTDKATVSVNVAGSSEPDNRDEYQRVEYITSDDNVYFITDFIADNSSGMEIVASFPALEDKVPMGSRVDSGATRFYCAYPLSASSCYFGFNTGSAFSCALDTDTKYRMQTNFVNSRLVNVYDMNGIRKGGTTISQTLTQQTCPVAIFCYNRTDTGAGAKRAFSLDSARISSGHEIVREYQPCYRKSDGEIVLREKFTGNILTSYGDGTLTKGPDIDWE